MTTAELAAKPQPLSEAKPARWLVALLLLAGAGLAYMPPALAGSTPDKVRLPLWLAIAMSLAASALWARRSNRLGAAWPPLFAFFVASAAQLIDWELSRWLPRLVGIPVQSPAGLALDKLESSLILVVVILILVLLAGDDLHSLYLRRGRLRRWLPIGITTFVLFALTPLTAAQALFGSGPIALDVIMPVLPWALIFVLTNGMAEELLFRGLLLPRLQPLIGTVPSVLVITMIFTLWHMGAGYTASLPIFLATVFCLGLAWAALTIKTDSLWGAVLFHAGADIPIVLALMIVL